jgi:phage terminase large subunit-like protein
VIANITARDKVESYVAGVLNGSIVVGRWIHLAVERYVRDLEQQDTEAFPFYLDEAAAEKACRFFSKVCKHSKGEWAGHPFDLEPWQAFIVWNVFGWKHTSDHARRFRKAIVLVGRKNGKTQLGAGIAHKMAVADGEEVAEVYCSATKKDQAMVLFDEAERMVRKSAALSKHSKIRHHRISFPATGSEIKPLGSDKPFDGLNPHGVLLDELHAWKEHHRPFFDTMVTASGARRQPLLCVLTTEGSLDSHLWIEERDYAVGVLEQQHKDETLFAALYAIDANDDWRDESIWQKANPNLGVSVKPDYLRQFASSAAFSVTKRNQFLRYHMNRVVSSTEMAIEPKLWDRCKGELSDWKNADVITSAFDIGGWDDLAGLGYVARFEDGIERDAEGNEKPSYRYEIDCKAYLYSESKRDIKQMPWVDWIHTGLIRREEFVINAIKQDILSEHEQSRYDSVSYDQHNAQQLGEDLAKEGLKAVAFRQNYAMYNEPLHQFLLLLEKGKIRHNGNPVLKWCAQNMAIKTGSDGKWMPCKKASKDKIDPMVAVIMAFRLAMLAAPRPKGSLFVF